MRFSCLSQMFKRQIDSYKFVDQLNPHRKLDSLFQVYKIMANTLQNTEENNHQILPVDDYRFKIYQYNLIPCTFYFITHTKRRRAQINIITTMSDIKSNSSYAMSAIEFNSKSLNPLDSINPAVITKIKRDADSYIGCANNCTLIWNALAKNDIAGQHLSEKVLENIFKEYQSDLYAFTRIGSLREFMRIFDQDKDGSLNSDEQINIFSFIKEKVELAANNCLQIQSYIMFEALMKEVRMLEQQISKWQEILRTKIHATQLKQYKKEGQNRVDEFCNNFDKEFENLQKLKIQRRQNFEKQAFYEQQQLEKRLSQSTEYIKIKPTNRLKQLQIQEKLVSLQQRVYEALDFRRQLSELEIKQRDRVDHLMLEHAKHQRENLRNKHTKHRRQLEIKLDELQNKLIIRMKKQFEILRKKNNLHEMQIKRLQGLEKKWGQRKALFEPELKRTKKLQKQRNQVLEEYKKSMFGSTKIQDDIQQSGGMSKFNAKSLLDATIKFKLTNRSTNDIPVNAREIKPSGNMGAMINKYITPKTSEKSYSLCKLYDSNLDELQVGPVVSESLKVREKNRKFNFAMEKLNK